jgi:hypothetical protein
VTGAPRVEALGELDGTGPLWGLASDDLNATFLAWPAGGGTPEYANAERDVLLVVLQGDGRIRLGDTDVPVGTNTAVLVPKGTRFAVSAGADGIRYLSVHLRRPGLEIGRFQRSDHATSRISGSSTPSDRQNTPPSRET